MGILLQHWILTATFFALPLILQKERQLISLGGQSHFYLPIMIIAFIAMVPLIVFAERKKAVPVVFLICISLETLSQALLSQKALSLIALYGIVSLYFVAFNFLEAALPSLVSQQAQKHNKGTAMGVYSSCQFLGIFLGGTSAGFLFELGGTSVIFITNMLLSIVWLTMSKSFKIVAKKE